MWLSKQHTIIIAEAGVNHNGDMGIARQLIDAAAEAGADYVKFQSFKAEKLVSASATKADYQKKNTGNEDDTQFEMLKKLELSETDHFELSTYAASRKIKFLSTAFDNDYVMFLNDLGIDFFKVPSGEITNLPYLETIANTKKPVVISTGMSDMKEIEDALNVFYAAGYSKDQLAVLHCNTQYPTPPGDVNLKAMQTIADAFGIRTGYSDHTLGTEASLAAVALGACIIEKHFTTDRQLPGPDHAASLIPTELKQMISGIRIIEQMIGDGVKHPTASELPNKPIARKSIHAAQRLEKGSKITMKDIAFLRPGNGISPMQYHNLLNKTLRHTVEEGQILRWEDFE